MVANYRPLRAPVYFTCLAQSSDPDLGTVTGSGKYLVGETVTLTAQPGERADFAGWMDEEGQLVSQESRYSFSITQDIILTAQFVRIYAVLVSVEPEGSGTVQGAGNYRQGQEAVLAAQESEGWLFTGVRTPGRDCGGIPGIPLCGGPGPHIGRPVRGWPRSVRSPESAWQSESPKSTGATAYWGRPVL